MVDGVIHSFQQPPSGGKGDSGRTSHQRWPCDHLHLAFCWGQMVREMLDVGYAGQHSDCTYFQFHER
jgi:hypothetical protein